MTQHTDNEEFLEGLACEVVSATVAALSWMVTNRELHSKMLEAACGALSVAAHCCRVDEEPEHMGALRGFVTRAARTECQRMRMISNGEVRR